MANTKRAQRALAPAAADGEAGAQAQFEAVKRIETVEFFGETFILAQRIGYLPMLKFAHSASSGLMTSDMSGLAAMYEMLQGSFERGEPCGECVICTGSLPGADADPDACVMRVGDEWPRFERHAMKVGASDEDLFELINRVLEIVTSRPTRARSDSSQRARTTSPNSKAHSSSRGRPPPDADGLTTVDEIAR